MRVDYYGVSTPIGQMATVSVPEARMITVKPWDKSAVKIVEKAIRDSDLGLNPQTDGDLIRLPIPPLTEERRKEMVKVAKKVGEECKVAIRKAVTMPSIWRRRSKATAMRAPTTSIGPRRRPKSW